MNLLGIVSRLYVSRKKIATFGVSAFIVGLVLGALLLNLPNFNISETAGPQSESFLSGYIGSGAFSATLPELTLQINAAQYSLPVDLSKVEGYKELRNWLRITPEQEQLLSQNGFVVLKVNNYGTLSGFYNYAYETGMPMLITTDAVLHAYHVFFDETLEEIETNEFVGEVNSMINTLLGQAQKEAASMAGTPFETASKLNLMYLEVAHALMQPSFTPTTVKAQQELQLILNHSAIMPSPIFGYEEDYTQYVPRGHYTDSEQLKAYFRTMMWFGRMRFGLLTDSVINVNQTRAAVLLTWMVTGNESVYSVWQKIYTTTGFFVGASDDLAFQDYLAVLNQEGIATPEQTLNESIVVNVAHELLNRSTAKILGTFAVVNPYLPSEEQLQEAFNETAGLRFMGQRFTPDSYMFQQLVHPQVTNRLFPKGLDVPAILGSDLAKQILNKTEAGYENYTQQIEKLRAEFGTLSMANWTQDLYWSWLYAANTTLAGVPAEAKYPTFMTTSAWYYEKLQTFEGTWTELRHDTILYAKQSNTGAMSIPPPPPTSTAYVEPNPATYRMIIGLANMTINGLTQLGLLSPQLGSASLQTEAWLTQFINASELFLNASTIELEGKTLDANLQYQIRQAAEEISTIESYSTLREAAIVADVHTDPNTEGVLEEALGNFSVAVVVYAEANGTLYSAAGPVYNHYEFTVPMSDRLTDEAWRGMLAANQMPEPPEWTDNFAR